MTKKNVWMPLIASIVWSALLIPGALLFPIENPSNLSYTTNSRTISPYVSLVKGNGDGILWIVVIPLVLTLVAAGLMALQVRTGSSLCGRAAWTIAALILAGAFAGAITFLVGVLAAPSGILLLLSVVELRRNPPLSTRVSHVMNDQTVLISQCGHQNDHGATYCITCGELLRP